MGNIRHVRAEKEDDCHYSETKPGQASSNALPEPQQTVHVYSVQPHLILSVLQHLIICLFVFFDSLLELDAVDLDAEQLMRESAVVVENITVINFPSLNACATQSIHGHCTASSDFVTPPNQHAVLKFNTLP